MCIDPTQPPRNPAELRKLLRAALGLHTPARPLLDGNAVPFDYLVHTFFEGRRWRLADGADPDDPAAYSDDGPAGPPDCVVWANRGGGKTFMGAVATLLDLVYKPEVQVRILGGSLEQSARMYAHLRRLFEIDAFAELVKGKLTERRVELHNGACAMILAQSEASIRGERVQKIRCDEVELFDPDVWTAAQLATRSIEGLKGPWGEDVRGTIEALSTMHRPHGLMWEIAGQAQKWTRRDNALRAGRPLADEPLADEPSAPPEADPGTPPEPDRGGRRLFRWGVVDVLARCGDRHRCETCPLAGDCRGAAKRRTARDEGHISVPDALTLKSRVDEATWASEMLSLRPRRTHAVLPEFDPAKHVTEEAQTLYGALAERELGIVEWAAGMDFGFRAPTVVVLGWLDTAGTLRIVDEHAAAEVTLDRHADKLVAWGPLGGRAGGLVPGPLAFLGVDPAGMQHDKQTGMSDISVLRARKLTVRTRPMKVADGLRLLRTRLAPADGSPPRLYIHPRCERLIDSLTRYHYEEDRPENETPVKDGSDHAVDALRYLVACLEAGPSCEVGNYLGKCGASLGLPVSKSAPPLTGAAAGSAGTAAVGGRGW